jgi:hypothetical protein
MKNLVYMTVFRNAGYIDLLALLLKTLKIKGCLNNETTDILLVTHPSMNDAIGEKVVPLDLRLHLWYIDLHELIDAARSRLLIFDYPQIHKYDKILYLDTDILINSDINRILDIPIQKDILYAGAEMTLDSPYHGGWLYGNGYPSVHMCQPAFSSGILFFRNSQKVKDMFYATNVLIHDEIVVKKKEPPSCLDQPYIVFNAAIRHMYNTTTITRFISAGRDHNVVNEDIVIYHFAGNIGHSNSKKEWMDGFIDKIIDFKPSSVSS